MIGLSTGFGYSQTMQQRQEERGTTVTKTPLQLIEEERMRRAQDVEKDYEAAMKRSKSSASTPAAPSDPWRNVRPAGATGDKK